MINSCDRFFFATKVTLKAIVAMSVSGSGGKILNDPDGITVGRRFFCVPALPVIEECLRTANFR